MANNLAAIVNCMQTPDATKEAPDLTNLQNLLNQDLGDYYSEPLLLEHKLVVVDMISRSFAEKGDLTTLANVTYDNIAQQVHIGKESFLIKLHSNFHPRVGSGICFREHFFLT